MQICPCCGKPKRPEGLAGYGTALKPAMELIAIARKPLSESTIAANVLKWGTGAINVDGCRVGMSIAENERLTEWHDKYAGRDYAHNEVLGKFAEKQVRPPHNLGRWPANICHDGSEEVLAGFPETNGQIGGCNDPNGSFGYHGGAGGKSIPGVKDSGSAARFFYCAKADADDRLASKHPTVKPVDLMQWLVRLVTPRGGTVLDCFAGTGTTGEAAFREGCKAILIERETEYQEDIRRRMLLALAGRAERKRESVKARKSEVDDGPLFRSPMTDDSTSKHSLSLEPNTADERVPV